VWLHGFSLPRERETCSTPGASSFTPKDVGGGLSVGYGCGYEEEEDDEVMTKTGECYQR
jgi:hypothetical protein